ncbi:MAG: glycoside hydrolase family 127 protein [Kiritimatiellaeota bacterium]|nr:glycoside hydrolase family 127 protein [Kiritimatiellota bacterium]
MSVPKALVDTSKSPHAELKNVGLDQVRWTTGFWSERRRQAAEVTLPHLWDRLADPEAGHVLQNLRIAAGLEEGEFRGVFWADAWMGKWLEAAAVLNGVANDEKLSRQMDQAIDLLAKVQAPDGYLASQTQADGLKRFQDPIRHELYTMGHLITAAIVHHRTTGKNAFLNLARRMGDFVHDTWAGEVPGHMVRFPFNPSIIMALVELYRETGQRKYLHAAKGFVDRRGSAPRKHGEYELHDWMGGDHCQDRVPLRQESEMTGHSVLSTYLYCGAADVFMETGEGALLAALKRIWRDYTERKMFINGGACAITRGLSNRGDPVHEAAGPEYFLPNALSYNETCAQIGVFMWAWRMLAAAPAAVYGDVMEQTLYSGILAGIGLDGKSWFYRNFLRWHGGERGPYTHDHKRYTCVRFQPGPQAICCPTNLLRLVGELHGYLYSTSEAGLWVHHYASATLSTRLADGAGIELRQETDYPWDGKVRITLETTPETPFSIKLRIPHWAAEAKLRVNGEKAGADVTPGTYTDIRRRWRKNDVIELLLPMQPRLLIAHPLVEELRNQVAVMRGPVLYCLESHDLPAGVPAREIRIPRDIEFEARYMPDILGGVTILEAAARRFSEGDWTDTLYKPLPEAPLEPVPVRLVPYYSWANRGVGEMTVWMPLC